VSLKEAALEKLAWVLSGIYSVDQAIYDAVIGARKFLESELAGSESTSVAVWQLLAQFILLRLSDFSHYGFDFRSTSLLQQEPVKKLPSWLEISKEHKSRGKSREKTERRIQRFRESIAKPTANKSGNENDHLKQIKTEMALQLQLQLPRLEIESSRQNSKARSEPR
jgi:hypothetical protein